MISVSIVGASGFTGEELVATFDTQMSRDVLTSRTHVVKK